MSEKSDYPHIKVVRDERAPIFRRVTRIEIDDVIIQRGVKGIDIHHHMDDATRIIIELIGTYEEVYEEE